MTEEDLVKVLKALGQEKRLRIVGVIGGEEWSVEGIGIATGIRQGLLSQHLRVLREAGVVDLRKSGKWSFYSVGRGVMVEVVERLGEL